jgi:hypothetical protein
MRRSVLALLTLLVVGSIALPAVASPQPRPVCGPCGAGFEHAAEREEMDITVTESVAVVRVHDDGSATWRVTNTLENESSAAALANGSRVSDSVLEYAIRRSAVEGPFENVSLHAEGRQVVITFEDRYAITRMPGGVHVLDYFHAGGYDLWYVVTADRLTVLGPEGTVVTNDPAGASVQGRNATWQGNASATFWDAPRVGEDTYVTFAEPGPAASALTTLAIALATLPGVLEVLLSIHLLPLLVFGILLGGVAAGCLRLAPRAPDQRTIAGLAALGGGVAAVAALAVGASFTGTAAGFAAVTLPMAGLVFACEDVRSGELTAVAALGLALAAVAMQLIASDAATAHRSILAFSGVFGSLPFAVAPVLGGCLATGQRRQSALLWGLAVASFLVVEILTVPPTDQPFGLVIFFLAIYAVGAAVLSAPFLLLGMAVAEAE